jgi:HTH-type transcriptional regulator / antitoxin HigA
MEIRPIKTKTDYHAALKEIETLMAAERDTPQGERLDVLVTLVEAYERACRPLSRPGGS